MRTDREQNVFQQITGSFDEPAFLRRARMTEGAWTTLLERAKRRRGEWLTLPSLRLGQLYMLSSKFEDLGGLISKSDVDVLHGLMRELAPEMRRRLRPATRDSQIADATGALIAAFNRFNTRWADYVCGIDFDKVNDLRTGYNRFYVIEKECALMSARTATRGFVPLPMVGREDVLEAMPLLCVPRLLT